MSNIFSKYEKELAGVKVIDSTQAYLVRTDKQRVKGSGVVR